MVTPLKLNTPDCLLGENPVWYAPAIEYLWTDILRGAIYVYAPETGGLRTVLETPYQTGAFLVSEDGNLVVFTERGVFAAMRCENGFRLLDKPLFTVPFADGERFNDAIADPCGQMLSGSKRADNTEGRLWRFSAGKEPEVLLEHLCISNGMGFSPDGRTFYHTDSIPSAITAYDYAPDQPLTNPRVVVQLEPDVDPDGMTVDEQGNLWFAVWGAGMLKCVSPQGEPVRAIPLEAKQCSSLCFGGERLSDLFVTSASVGGKEGESPLGGGCYLLKNTGTGKPEYPAKTHLVGV